MRNGRSLIVAFGCLLASTLVLRSDEGTAARELVDKAIKAHGGDNLTKNPFLTSKMKGTFHGLGAASAFTGEVMTQGGSKHKLVINGEFMNVQFSMMQVLNGEKGWIKINNDTTELDKDKLADVKEEIHSEWVTTLVPLKDKTYTLSSVGEITIDKRPAIGVKATRKGHREVNLYFDKQTNLLVKTEYQVKDDKGQEVSQESFLSDYKDVKGTKQAMKFSIKRDGKIYVEGEVTEAVLAEKADDNVFDKP